MNKHYYDSWLGQLRVLWPSVATDIILVENTGECCVCNHLTNCLEINFEAWLCSPECHQSLWASYFIDSTPGLVKSVE